MGLYDTVKRDPITCPTCGAEIKDFQSKSGHMQLFTVTEEQLVEDAKRYKVDRPYYYGYCDSCRTRVDFEYIPGHWEQTHETFEKRQENTTQI